MFVVCHICSHKRNFRRPTRWSRLQGQAFSSSSPRHLSEAGPSDDVMRGFNINNKRSQFPTETNITLLILKATWKWMIQENVLLKLDPFIPVFMMSNKVNFKHRGKLNRNIS